MKRTLKLMAMLLCVFALAGLSSCSKNNEDRITKDNKDLIVGTWKLVKMIDENRHEDTFMSGLTYTFYSNGTCECFGLSGSWSIDGDRLIFEEDDRYIIEKLTSSEMIWRKEPPAQRKYYLEKIR